MERAMSWNPSLMKTDTLLFYLNGKPYRLTDLETLDGNVILLDYLRNVLRLTGTKLGCGEGGCGACTVMVTSYDMRKKKPIHRAVNACLTPLLSIHGCHITTVEGLGNRKQGYHPIQTTLAENHGSQCGFCTPGIVMNMFSLLYEREEAYEELTETNSRLTLEEIEHNFDGNLCRCTGYRPILDAFKKLTAFDIEDLDKACNTLRCKSCGYTHGTHDDQAENDKMASEENHECRLHDGEDCKDKHRKIPKLAIDYPKELFYAYNTSAVFQTKTMEWIRPTTLQELLYFKYKYPTAHIVVGNSEHGIEAKFKGIKRMQIIHAAHVEELLRIDVCEEGVRVGANVTWTLLSKEIETIMAREPEYKTYNLRAIKDQLKWFAGKQIRNVGTVAGNIVTASPISDMNPVWVACDAVFTLTKGVDVEILEYMPSTQIDIAQRQVLARDFFIGYRKVDLHPDEILDSVLIPWTTKFEYTMPFKVSRRKEDDIAIVSACIRYRLKQEGEKWKLDDVALAFGGMAPVTLVAKQARTILEDAEFSDDIMTQVIQAISKELTLPRDVPGGMAEYRQIMAQSFVYKSFIKTVQSALKDMDLFHMGSAAKEMLLAQWSSVMKSLASVSDFLVTTPEKPLVRSSQIHDMQVHQGAQEANFHVGKNVPHSSGLLQCSGEAEYVDDIELPASTGFAMFITSSMAHARIVSTNFGAVLMAPGVIDVITAADVPGENTVGQPPFYDEELFATTHVHFVGQVIALVVARTKAEAVAASRLAKIDYEELPAVLCIEDAIQQCSFAKDIPEHYIEQGDVDKAFSCFDALSMEDESEAARAKLENLQIPLSTANGYVKGHTYGSLHSETIQAMNPTSFFTDVHLTSNSYFSESELAYLVQGTVRIGAQEHFYLETHGSYVAPVDSGREFHMIVSTQAVGKTQMYVSRVLGIPSHRVVCKTKRMGGGFGGKETRNFFMTCAVAVAANKLNRPVHLFLDRDTDMKISGQRHPFLAKYRAKCLPSGIIQALQVQVYHNMGWSLDLSLPILDRCLFHIDNTYHIENIRFKGRMCYTNTSSNTAFRGFGGPQGMMICENVMDHVARVLRMPAEKVRHINMYNDKNSVTPFGMAVSPDSIQSCWRNVLEQSEFDRRRAEVVEFNKHTRHRKRGICAIPTKFGISFTFRTFNQAGALIHIYTDGAVLVTHGGTEMGQGLHVKMQQVTATALQVDMSKVFISETTSDKVPNASPTAASASSDMYGMAILDACNQLNERLKEYRKPDSTWEDVVKHAYFDRVNLSAQGFYKTPDLSDIDLAKNTKGSPFFYFTYGAAVSEVEVDCLTGEFDVLRTDIVMDIGQSLNPAIDIGQIEGGFVQGMGWCTMEEFVRGGGGTTKFLPAWIRPAGSVFTVGPSTYKIPGFYDIPRDFRVRILNQRKCEVETIHSSKAVGEPPFFLGATVMFAIKEACYAAREEWMTLKKTTATGHVPINPGGTVAVFSDHFMLDSPASVERVRMACLDHITEKYLQGTQFQSMLSL